MTDVTDWIFQGNPKHHELHVPASRRTWWSTPRYRDRTAAGDRLRSFRPFRGFQGSTVPVPPDIATVLWERAAPRLEALDG